jgi:uncharacterized ion transporter superfamily protein YfcC
VGTGAGFAAGFLNPFTTGIAQGVAELPLFSGVAFRLICYVLLVGSSILYVYYYNHKISTNRAEKFISPLPFDFNIDDVPELGGKHKRVFVAVVVFLLFLVYAVLRLNYHILELSTIFLITGIVCGLLAGFKPGKIATEFLNGASNLLAGALIIGLSRAILMVMVYGNIMDTVIYSLATAIQGFPPVLSANLMFLAQSVINIFITSGSGQATVTMPIMADVADIAGFSRQTAVLALQFGDGFSNVISPTSGYFMAALAIGGVKWEKWVKFMWPLFLIWCAIAVVMMVFAVATGYGPF